ncbi:MAG: DUF4340 domain-containing protein [Eubacteriales bacterium]|nr:DUF4340 domain-containing protein [Eubacteriales bacterium]
MKSARRSLLTLVVILSGLIAYLIYIKQNPAGAPSESDALDQNPSTLTEESHKGAESCFDFSPEEVVELKFENGSQTLRFAQTSETESLPSQSLDRRELESSPKASDSDQSKREETTSVSSLADGAKPKAELKFRLIEPDLEGQSTIRVESLIDHLLNLKSERSFTVEDKAANYGLEPAQASLSYRLKSGRVVKIEIGDSVPTKLSSYYIRESGSSQVFVVNGLSQILELKAYELMDSSLLPITLDAVEKFEFKREKDQVNLIVEATSSQTTAALPMSQASRTWTLTSPLHFEADSDRVEAFIQELLHASAQSCIDYLDQEDDGKRYGFDEASYRVRFWTKEGAPIELFIGSEDQAGNFYVKTTRNPGVYLVARSSFTCLDMELKDFLSPFAMFYNISDIEAIDLKLPGETVSLEMNVPSVKQRSSAKSDAEKQENFVVNGEKIRGDEVEKVQAFKTLYQSLIGVKIAGIDDTVPKSSQAIYEIRYKFKDRRPDSVLQLTRRNDDSYYISIDGTGTSLYCHAEDVISDSNPDDLGIEAAYHKLEEALRGSNQETKNNRESE